MTISSTTRKAGPFDGNGVTTSFPFTFKVFAKSDLRVVHTTPGGVESDLVLDSDYSVALNADQDANPGGTVTYPLSGAPLPAYYKLTLAGGLDYMQPTDITNGGGFYPQVVENGLDRLTMLIQQLGEELDRAVRIAISDDQEGLDLPAAAARADRVLGFDANGNFRVYDRAVATVTTIYRKFTPTEGQTVFTLPQEYTTGANSLYVFLNGAKLVNGADYEESSPLTFTLTVGATAGDSIEVIAGVPLASGTVADSSQVSYTPSGAGAVPRTVQGKLRDVVSVKDFGASGDGVADDTAEIQAAINYCQSSKCALYFPAGTYNISANLVIPLSGSGMTNAQKFRMFGAGKHRDTSMIKAVNVAVTKIIQCSSTAGNDDFLLEIDRLSLNGNNLAQYGLHGIAIQHLSMNYCWVQGCTEAGFYGTGSVSGGYCNEFRESTFYQNKIGIVLGGAVNQTLLDHCKFWGNEIGLDLITTQAVKLDNSMFESNTVVGARILGNAITFDTCYFENNSTVGIVFTTPSTTVKADIYIKGGSSNSILEISSPSKSVAIRNCFTQVGDSANGCFVFAAAATGLVLEGNNCKSNAQAPLLRTYFNSSYSFLRNVRALSNTDFSKQIDLLAYSTSVLLSAARLLNWFRSDTAQLRNYANAELNEWTFNSVLGGSGGTWSRSAQKYRGDVPVWELENPATSLSYYARFTLSAADFPENIGKFFSFVLPMKASGAGAIVTFTSTAFAAQASIATDWEHSASIFEWPASGTLTFGFAFSGLAGSVHVATPMLYEIGADAESLASDFGVQRIFYGSAAPTAGTWKLGDVVLNNAPSAAGVPGWVCVTAGAPGTWKAMAVVAS